MNKLIEKLWDKFAIEIRYCTHLDDVDLESFKKCIESACQAQRNACKRVANEAESFDELINKINNAEITEADYE